LTADIGKPEEAGRDTENLGDPLKKTNVICMSLTSLNARDDRLAVSACPAEIGLGQPAGSTSQPDDRASVSVSDGVQNRW